MEIENIADVIRVLVVATIVFGGLFLVLWGVTILAQITTGVPY